MNYPHFMVLPNLNSGCGYKICSGCCNMSTRSSFRNEWLRLLLSGRKCYCPLKIALGWRDLLHPRSCLFLGQLAHNDWSMQKAHPLCCKVGITLMAFSASELLVGSAEDLVQPGFSFCPTRVSSPSLPRHRSKRNFLKSGLCANFHLRGHFIGNLNCSIILMQCKDETPHRKTLEKEVTITVMCL
jgi:hypothetical protein